MIRDCTGPQATEKTPAKETTLLTEASIEIVKQSQNFAWNRSVANQADFDEMSAEFFLICLIL